MHKKLESELMSIAHSILQMKNKNDALALRNKAQELYERLTVLTFVDEYLESTPDAVETKDELIEKIENAVKETPEKSIVKEIVNEVVQEEVEELKEEAAIIIDEATAVKEVVSEVTVNEEQKQDSEEREVKLVEETVDEVMAIANEPVKKQLTLDEEFKDAISVDVTADLFQKAETKTTSKPSLNDTLMQKNIQVGLNDRIAFVKHLFNHSQADFNRVLSQLNSIDNEKEAKNFINKMVKPDYDWSGKEEFEERLIALVERKF